jgi:hypothetical protein
MQDFWRALGEAVIDEEGFLQLPGGIYLLGQRLLGSTLYIRDAYRGLWAEINAVLDSTIPRVGILGGYARQLGGYVRQCLPAVLTELVPLCLCSAFEAQPIGRPSMLTHPAGNPGIGKSMMGVFLLQQSQVCCDITGHAVETTMRVEMMRMLGACRHNGGPLCTMRGTRRCIAMAGTRMVTLMCGGHRLRTPLMNC